MTDEKGKPPWPRRPGALGRSGSLPPHDEDIVEVPPTERVPRTPPRTREPFAKLVQTPAETVREVLDIQRKMALQLDGFGQAMNRRFDLFHEELALQRADLAIIASIVQKDHGPRIAKTEKTVEKLTPQQKAKAAGIIAARFGAWGTGGLFFGGLALRALAKLYPDYGDLIEGLLAWVGL